MLQRGADETQLLGVILSGLRRIGNKPSHQEVHKETRGKHRRIKLTILEIHSLLPSHGPSHSLSAYKDSYLTPSLSLACLHVIAAMCVCESSRPCKGGHGCVGVCVDVCEHIFFHVCLLSLHVCAYIGVLYTYMHACMHVHRFTYPCDSGWSRSLPHSQNFSLWSGQENKETLALCLNFVLNIWFQIFFSHGSIISPEATFNWIPNIDVNFSKIEILSGLLAYFQTK